MKRDILSLLIFFLTSNVLFGQSVDYGNNKEAGQYKKINGINLYYEIYGKGKPLILLHGNGGSIIGQRGKIKHFESKYQVIAIDSRSHGKSTDTLNPTLTYIQMAEDVRVLMDSLEIESVNIFGQSDGGIIGLILASKYLKRITKLATFGANIFPKTKAIFSEIVKHEKDSLKSLNKNTRKLSSLMVYQPNITQKDLEKIECPVLIMSGDRDAIRLKHSIKIFYAIKNSNFFVMPGGSHGGSWQKPDLFNLVLSDFLEKPFSKLSTVEIVNGKQ